MRDSDFHRLQRQVDDAASRLHRTSGQGAIVLGVSDIEGVGMGVAFSVKGPRLGQMELALYMMLRKLEQDLLPGAAEQCETCSAAYARVSAAVAALAPGFGAGADVRGRC